MVAAAVAIVVAVAAVIVVATALLAFVGCRPEIVVTLETRIHSMHMEESIFDVTIPMEDVVEFKGGRKVIVLKKQFPGYLLVRM